MIDGFALNAEGCRRRKKIEETELRDQMPVRDQKRLERFSSAPSRDQRLTVAKKTMYLLN